MQEIKKTPFTGVFSFLGRSAGNRTRPTCTPCTRTADILRSDIPTRHHPWYHESNKKKRRPHKRGRSPSNSERCRIKLQLPILIPHGDERLGKTFLGPIDEPPPGIGTCPMNTLLLQLQIPQPLPFFGLERCPGQLAQQSDVTPDELTDLLAHRSRFDNVPNRRRIEKLPSQSQ